MPSRRSGIPDEDEGMYDPRETAEGDVMGDVIRNERFRRQTARQRARIRERLARRRPWEMENVRDPGRTVIARLPLRRERRR